MPTVKRVRAHHIFFSACSALSIIGVLIATSSCGLVSGSHGYRYRLTVNVRTPAGLRSGSSVIDVSAQGGSGLNGSYIHSSIAGEAVAIELPNGVTLYGLLRSVDGLHGAYASAAIEPSLPATVIKSGNIATYMKAFSSDRVVRNVPSKDLPMFAYFSKARDPNTVKLINSDEMGTAFGAGYQIESVKVVITEDNATFNLSAKLPWLGADSGQPIISPHSMYDQSLVGSLTTGDFVQKRRWYE